MRAATPAPGRGLSPCFLQEFRSQSSGSTPGPLTLVPGPDARSQLPATPRRPYHVHSVEDADPQSHEGLGEVDDLLPLSSDGEGCHSQVCLLLEGKQVGRREGGTRQRRAVRDTQAPLRVRAETGGSSVPVPLTNHTMVKTIAATLLLFGERLSCCLG